MSLCPMLCEPCRSGRCAWYCKDEGKCAIALLPSTLDWLTSFAVTKPYEKGDEEK